MEVTIHNPALLLQRLSEAHVDFVIIGGVAALIHGSTVVTRDVDVCIRFDERTLRALATALADLHPKHRITPKKLPFEITDQNWASLKNLYLQTDWGILDCLGEVAALGAYEEVVKNSESTLLPFGTCRVLTMDALIRSKEAVGRPHDLQATAQLRQLKRKMQLGQESQPRADEDEAARDGKA